jgi:hypothetical protein
MTTVYVAADQFTYNGATYHRRDQVNFNTSSATLADDLEALLRVGALSTVDPGNPSSPPANITPDAKANWYTGSGIPSSSLGSDRDMYLDTTGKLVFGPKASGSWGSGYALGTSVVTLTGQSGTVTLNLSQGSVFVVNITGNVTGWSFSNPGNSGQYIEVHFVQDATGSQTLAGANSSIKLAGGALTLTTTANKRDIIRFRQISGTYYECARTLNVG